MAERTATPGIPKIVAKCEKGGRATWCRLQMRGFKKNAKKTKQLSLRQQRYAPKHEDD